MSRETDNADEREAYVARVIGRADRQQPERRSREGQSRTPEHSPEPDKGSAGKEQQGQR